MRLRSLAIELILVLAWLVGKIITGSAESRPAPPPAPMPASAAVAKQTEDGESRPASPADSLPASAPVMKKKERKCLDCHDPFDKLIEASAGYIAPSGEKTSPHRYVPHDSKQPEDIPECIHCHAAHPLSPLPAKGAIDLSKVSVQWCYDCHHDNTLKSCKECHP
jgi:hypothetical protein